MKTAQRFLYAVGNSRRHKRSLVRSKDFPQSLLINRLTVTSARVVAVFCQSCIVRSGKDIQIASQRPLVDIDSVQRRCTAIVAPIVANFLQSFGTTRHQGTNYTAYWDDKELVLASHSDSQPLMRAIYKDERWEAVERGQLTVSDVQQFQRVQQQRRLKQEPRYQQKQRENQLEL